MANQTFCMHNMYMYIYIYMYRERYAVYVEYRTVDIKSLALVFLCQICLPSFRAVVLERRIPYILSNFALLVVFGETLLPRGAYQPFNHFSSVDHNK